MIKTISKILFSPIRWVQSHSHHLLFHFCLKKKYENFTLYAIDPETAEPFFNIAIKSLMLIKELDPRRYSRVQKRILNIANLGCGVSHYHHEANAFYVDEFNPNDIRLFAGEIIHEATHGLLRGMGFSYLKERREQHERICLDEQYRFMRKAVLADCELSDREKQAEIQRLKDCRSQVLKTQWWEPKITDEQRKNRLKTLLFKKVVIRKRCQAPFGGTDMAPDLTPEAQVPVCLRSQSMGFGMGFAFACC